MKTNHVQKQVQVTELQKNTFKQILYLYSYFYMHYDWNGYMSDFTFKKTT